MKMPRSDYLPSDPWGNFKVSFELPRSAARRLRDLAVSADRRLKDIGILKVQITELKEIVLADESRQDELWRVRGNEIQQRKGYDRDRALIKEYEKFNNPRHYGYETTEQHFESVPTRVQHLNDSWAENYDAARSWPVASQQSTASLSKHYSSNFSENKTPLPSANARNGYQTKIIGISRGVETDGNDPIDMFSFEPVPEWVLENSVCISLKRNGKLDVACQTGFGKPKPKSKAGFPASELVASKENRYKVLCGINDFPTNSVDSYGIGAHERHSGNQQCSSESIRILESLANSLVMAGEEAQAIDREKEEGAMYSSTYRRLSRDDNDNLHDWNTNANVSLTEPVKEPRLNALKQNNMHFPNSSSQPYKNCSPPTYNRVSPTSNSQPRGNLAGSAYEMNRNMLPLDQNQENIHKFSQENAKCAYVPMISTPAPFSRDLTNRKDNSTDVTLPYQSSEHFITGSPRQTALASRNTNSYPSMELSFTEKLRQLVQKRNSDENSFESCDITSENLGNESLNYSNVNENETRKNSPNSFHASAFKKKTNTAQTEDHNLAIKPRNNVDTKYSAESLACSASVTDIASSSMQKLNISHETFNAFSENKVVKVGTQDRLNDTCHIEKQQAVKQRSTSDKNTDALIPTKVDNMNVSDQSPYCPVVFKRKRGRPPKSSLSKPDMMFGDGKPQKPAKGVTNSDQPKRKRGRPPKMKFPVEIKEFKTEHVPKSLEHGKDQNMDFEKQHNLPSAVNVIPCSSSTDHYSVKQTPDNLNNTNEITQVIQDPSDGSKKHSSRTQEFKSLDSRSTSPVDRFMERNTKKTYRVRTPRRYLKDLVYLDIKDSFDRMFTSVGCETLDIVPEDVYYGENYPIIFADDENVSMKFVDMSLAFKTAMRDAAARKAKPTELVIPDVSHVSVDSKHQATCDQQEQILLEASKKLAKHVPCDRRKRHYNNQDIDKKYSVKQRKDNSVISDQCKDKVADASDDVDAKPSHIMSLRPRRSINLGEDYSSSDSFEEDAGSVYESDQSSDSEPLINILKTAPVKQFGSSDARENDSLSGVVKTQEEDSGANIGNRSDSVGFGSKYNYFDDINIPCDYASQVSRSLQMAMNLKNETMKEINVCEEDDLSKQTAGNIDAILINRHAGGDCGIAVNKERQTQHNQSLTDQTKIHKLSDVGTNDPDGSDKPRSLKIVESIENQGLYSKDNGHSWNQSSKTLLTESSKDDDKAFSCSESTNNNVDLKMKIFNAESHCESNECVGDGIEGANGPLLSEIIEIQQLKARHASELQITNCANNLEDSQSRKSSLADEIRAVNDDSRNINEGSSRETKETDLIKGDTHKLDSQESNRSSESKESLTEKAVISQLSVVSGTEGSEKSRDLQLDDESNSHPPMITLTMQKKNGDEETTLSKSETVNETTENNAHKKLDKPELPQSSQEETVNPILGDDSTKNAAARPDSEAGRKSQDSLSSIAAAESKKPSSEPQVKGGSRISTLIKRSIKAITNTLSGKNKRDASEILASSDCNDGTGTSIGHLKNNDATVVSDFTLNNQPERLTSENTVVANEIIQQQDLSANQQVVSASRKNKTTDTQAISRACDPSNTACQSEPIAGYEAPMKIDINDLNKPEITSYSGNMLYDGRYMAKNRAKMMGKKSGVRKTFDSEFLELDSYDEAVEADEAPDISDLSKTGSCLAESGKADMVVSNTKLGIENRGLILSSEKGPAKNISDTGVNEQSSVRKAMDSKHIDNRILQADKAPEFPEHVCQVSDVKESVKCVDHLKVQAAADRESKSTSQGIKELGKDPATELNTEVSLEKTRHITEIDAAKGLLGLFVSERKSSDEAEKTIVADAKISQGVQESHSEGISADDSQGGTRGVECYDKETEGRTSDGCEVAVNGFLDRTLPDTVNETNAETRSKLNATINLIVDSGTLIRDTSASIAKSRAPFMSQDSKLTQNGSGTVTAADASGSLNAEPAGSSEEITPVVHNQQTASPSATDAAGECRNVQGNSESKSCAAEDLLERSNCVLKEKPERDSPRAAKKRKLQLDEAQSEAEFDVMNNSVDDKDLKVSGSNSQRHKVNEGQGEFEDSSSNGEISTNERDDDIRKTAELDKNSAKEQLKTKKEEGTKGVEDIEGKGVEMSEEEDREDHGNEEEKFEPKRTENNGAFKEDQATAVPKEEGEKIEKIAEKEIEQPVGKLEKQNVEQDEIKSEICSIKEEGEELLHGEEQEPMNAESCNSETNTTCSSIEEDIKCGSENKNISSNSISESEDRSNTGGMDEELLKEGRTSACSLSKPEETMGEDTLRLNGADGEEKAASDQNNKSQNEAEERRKKRKSADLEIVEEKPLVLTRSMRKHTGSPAKRLRSSRS